MTRGLFGAPPSPTDWSRQTLLFIRLVTQQPAKYPSAAVAAEHSNLRSGEPEIGGFCWYRTDNGFGNVSLYLADHRVLCIQPMGGYPAVLGWQANILGEYIGWSKQIGPDS